MSDRGDAHVIRSLARMLSTCSSGERRIERETVLVGSRAGVLSSSGRTWKPYNGGNVLFDGSSATSRLLVTTSGQLLHNCRTLSFRLLKLFVIL